MRPGSYESASDYYKEARRIRVHFDQSTSRGLREILLGAPDLFEESGPEDADVILLERDELPYLRANPLVRRFRPKCLCISETDIPTFALPGLYAANIASWLTSGRTETISYFVSERAKGNPAVRRLRGEAVEKRYLYSFLGGANSWPRKFLFRLAKPAADVIVEPTNSYDHWSLEGQELDAKARQQERYARILAESKFALCPRGCGLSSYRLFEAMSLGVAPVVIADGWRPISGLDWSFALFVREREISKVDAIVRAHKSEWRERGAAARAAYERLLAPERIAATVHERLGRVLAARDPWREAALAPALVARVRAREVHWAVRAPTKSLLLQFMKATRLPPPVVLRYPVKDQIVHERQRRATRS